MRRPWRTLAAGVVLLLALSTHARGQAQPSAPTGPPGLGILVGEGRTANGATLRRAGFTTGRLSDGGRIGSLALVAEEHVNGVPFDLLDAGVASDDVTLRYQSVALSLKNYRAILPRTLLYWGVRGGYSRVVGRVERNGTTEEFVAESVAPLGLLALPLALEHPGFLMLAFLDGTAAGITFDLVPDHMWLDFQVDATLLPQYRDANIVLDERFSITRTLQLVLTF